MGHFANHCHQLTAYNEFMNAFTSFVLTTECLCGLSWEILSASQKVMIVNPSSCIHLEVETPAADFLLSYLLYLNALKKSQKSCWCS